MKGAPLFLLDGSAQRHHSGFNDSEEKDPTSTDFAFL